MILIRHAEALLWAGRYLERAETAARCLDEASRTVMHLLPEEAEIEWGQMLRGLGLGAELNGRTTYEQAVIDRLLSGPDDPGSVRFGVEALRNNLRIVRDRTPVELFEEANRLHLWLQNNRLGHPRDSASHEFHATVRRGCQTISGIIAEAMPRDAAHAFIVVGRMLERSILTVELVRAALTHPSGRFDADRLLRATSSLQAFRRSGRDQSDHLAVAALLLEAPTLPRSVLSCLRRTEGRITVLSSSASTFHTPLQMCGRIRSRLEYGELVDDLGRSAEPTVRRLGSEIIELADLTTEQLTPPMGTPAFHAQFVRPGLDER